MPMRAKLRVTKAWLEQRCRILTRERDELGRQLNAITPATVPYTAEEDIRQGTTVLVRVPKPFVPRSVNGDDAS
jgi:hypothetical protein